MHLLKLHYPEYSIKSVSEQAGFFSYSSFYRFFKKHTGMTPEKYIIQIKKSKPIEKTDY